MMPDAVVVTAVVSAIEPRLGRHLSQTFICFLHLTSVSMAKWQMEGLCHTRPAPLHPSPGLTLGEAGLGWDSPAAEENALSHFPPFPLG